MATKVLYKQGTKATYLGLLERSPNALYWCTDTRELFKGNDLYTDGIRFVASYAALPMVGTAADGKIYYCNDSGCGYVLNEERTGWVMVIHGVDNTTVAYNTDGLLQVKAVPLSAVTGLSDELTRIEGMIPADNSDEVASLGERISAVEQVVVGGVRYCGAVDTYEQLPADAKVGDLYEVYADNSEWCWNGEKWFEYGKTTVIDLSDYATKEDIAPLISKEEVYDVTQLVKYEISSKPVGTLVNYMENEIRVMCPADTQWVKQAVGATGNANMYYMGFKAYAPEGAVSFKEGDSGVIIDEMFDFSGDFAGTDKYGRNYSIVWLALASYDEASDTWTYFGKNSSSEKYVGWDYVVEWYNADGICIDSDSIRINLSNESCHLSSAPAYVTTMQNTVETIEESVTWGDM